MDFLREPHNMKAGEKVTVCLRNNPNEVFNGTIYKIIKLPTNSAMPNLNIVDYFYVTFTPDVYSKLLLRGSEIIYNHNSSVIGKIVVDSHNNIITEMTLQFLHAGDQIANPNNINAMLIWRVAYDIQPAQ